MTPSREDLALRLRGSRNTFPLDRHQHRRIVRLIAQRTRFSILNPEIGPVIVDLQS